MTSDPTSFESTRGKPHPGFPNMRLRNGYVPPLEERHDASCSGCQILGWMHTAESLGAQLASQDLRIKSAIDLFESVGPDESISPLTTELITRTLRGEA